MNKSENNSYDDKSENGIHLFQSIFNFEIFTILADEALDTLACQVVKQASSNMIDQSKEQDNHHKHNKHNKTLKDLPKHDLYNSIKAVRYIIFSIKIESLSIRIYLK